MAKLGDMLDENELDGNSGERIPVGRHEVAVNDYKLFVCNSGSPGIEYEVRDALGRKHKVTFVLKPGSKGNLQAFNAWLSALGLEKNERADFDPDVDRYHEKLISKHVIIEVEKKPNAKYSEVKPWEYGRVDLEITAQTSTNKASNTTPTGDDDLPF